MDGPLHHPVEGQGGNGLEEGRILRQAFEVLPEEGPQIRLEGLGIPAAGLHGLGHRRVVLEGQEHVLQGEVLVAGGQGKMKGMLDANAEGHR